MTKFSICIPAYKDKFLKECITSILNQTNSDFELIILNDCSPYPIRQITDIFDDLRIKYFENQHNVGAENLIQNWNKLLSLASGDYIMIMGDDDKLESNYLEEFSLLIERFPKPNVYHCRSKIIDDNSTSIMLSPSWPELESVYDNIWHRVTERRAQYISDFVYKTSYLKSCGGFFYLPLAWGSDDITAYNASVEHGIAHTNNPVFNYRSNSLSITSSGNDPLKMDTNLLYSTWLKEFLKERPKNDADFVTYEYLCKNFAKLMQKRKIRTMISSFSSDSLATLYFWFTNRKKYNLSNLEIVYAFTESLKLRKSKAQY